MKLRRNLARLERETDTITVQVLSGLVGFSFDFAKGLLDYRRTRYLGVLKFAMVKPT